MFIKNHYEMQAPEIMTIPSYELSAFSHEFIDQDEVICFSNQTDGTVELQIKTQIGDQLVPDTLLILMPGQESACTRAVCGSLKNSGPIYFAHTATMGHFIITTFKSKTK